MTCCLQQTHTTFLLVPAPIMRLSITAIVVPVWKVAAFRAAKRSCDRLGHMLFKEARSGAEKKNARTRVFVGLVSTWRPQDMIDRWNSHIVFFCLLGFTVMVFMG